MKTDLITKFLRHLAQKHQGNGFTLIELLVVIVIIGILAAIALPSFLNQANKARQSEAKTYVGAINRAQQAYFIEYGEFGVAAELEGGTAMMTRNYTYNIVPNNAVTPPGASVSAAANRRNLKSYAGIVVADRNQMATVICETITTTQVSPSAGYNIATRTTVCNGNSAPVNQ